MKSALAAMLAALRASLRTPTAEELARRELDEAKRELLLALSAQEYAARMVDYHTARVTCLRNVPGVLS